MRGTRRFWPLVGSAFAGFVPINFAFSMLWFRLHRGEWLPIDAGIIFGWIISGVVFAFGMWLVLNRSARRDS